jgi:Flp pilus assembly pilin Flp
MSRQRPIEFEKDPATLGDESGQALTEYSLVLALVSITALGLSPLGQWLSTTITDIASAI